MLVVNERPDVFLDSVTIPTEFDIEYQVRLNNPHREVDI